ncbi:F-box/kelch-repeat protein At1g23390 [Manihot esculenta]|uniref:F-box/kelch-repeat protein At1g23390 n=1 Tax=Manihot esculenta TaxID=3983 RepID=UPI000B5D0D64|nr:F-box/kelch-repeat protein At1g23390 [Manihot esculenta]
MAEHSIMKREQTTTTKAEKEEAAASIHGDILESVLTHVPLIDLVPASHVSKSWKRAVSTSLRHFNKIKPWLLLHSQATRSPYSTTAYAFDPRSCLWLQIRRPPIKHISPLRSSHSTLLYMLSSSKFSFSVDPLHLTWHHVDAPVVWRTDPIVAVVGHRVIVAGGACDFEDDPLAVEMYDLKTRTWDTCESLPAHFKDSAASMWLSVAVRSNKMYVVEKSTGVTYWFNPETKSWYGPYSLRPQRNVYSSAIGFADDRLILICLIGDDHGEEVTSVKLWELNDASFKFCKEIGEMPEQLIEKLRGDTFSISSAIINVMGDFVYISNTSAPEEVIFCEFGSGPCRWSSVRNAVVNDHRRLTERLVFTCANVGMSALQRAINAEDTQFAVLGRARELS